MDKGIKNRLSEIFSEDNFIIGRNKESAIELLNELCRVYNESGVSYILINKLIEVLTEWRGEEIPKKENRCIIKGDIWDNHIGTIIGFDEGLYLIKLDVNETIVAHKGDFEEING